jgi:hypothetical protein
MTQSRRPEPKEETAMTLFALTETMEELDHRENDGIAVSLLWNRTDNRLSVVVEDNQLGESFTLSARPDNARDVFTHPYAYAQLLLAA